LCILYCVYYSTPETKKQTTLRYIHTFCQTTLVNCVTALLYNKEFFPELGYVISKYVVFWMGNEFGDSR